MSLDEHSLQYKQSWTSDKIIHELLHEAQHHQQKGMFKQTEALLTQAWISAERGFPDLANIAAWNIAWLLLQQEEYDAAALWFNRVTAPTASLIISWMAARQVLIHMCLTSTPKFTASNLEVPDPTNSVPQAPTTSDISDIQLMPPPLEVSSLGEFSIKRSGEVLPICKSNKATAIFRYLLTCPGYRVHKEELMELFWPDMCLREATHNLHVAISTLRHNLSWKLVPRSWEYIVHDRGYYLVNAAARLEDQCKCFEDLCNRGKWLVQQGQLQQAEQVCEFAVQTYQGDYYVYNCDYPWALVERERLLRVYLETLDRLGGMLLAQQLYQAAISCYERILQRDSYREDAHYKLMHCFWQLGNRSEALKQYERCVEILSKELLLRPAQEIERLRLTILSS